MKPNEITIEKSALGWRVLITCSECSWNMYLPVTTDATLLHIEKQIEIINCSDCARKNKDPEIPLDLDKEIENRVTLTKLICDAANITGHDTLLNMSDRGIAEYMVASLYNLKRFKSDYDTGRIFERPWECPDCNMTTKPCACVDPEATKEKPAENYDSDSVEKCPHCDGRGWTGPEGCEWCSGKGFRVSEPPKEIPGFNVKEQLDSLTISGTKPEATEEKTCEWEWATGTPRLYPSCRKDKHCVEWPTHVLGTRKQRCPYCGGKIVEKTEKLV